MQKHSTARKQKSQLLSDEELKRCAERVAVALEQSSLFIGLLCLLIDNLDKARADPVEFNNAVYTIKKHLFVNTAASDDAQDKFESEAFQNRGKLLLWPREREAK